MRLRVCPTPGGYPEIWLYGYERIGVAGDCVRYALLGVDMELMIEAELDGWQMA